MNTIEEKPVNPETVQNNGQETKVPENPKQWVFHPDAKIVFTPEQYNFLDRYFRQYELPLAIFNSKRDEMMGNGSIMPVYEKDIVKNKDGNDELRPDFWETPKKENNSVTLDQITEKVNKTPKLEVVK